MGLVGWDGSGGVGGVGHELDGCTAGWLAARQSQPTSCLVRRGRLQYCWLDHAATEELSRSGPK